MVIEETVAKIGALGILRNDRVFSFLSLIRYPPSDCRLELILLVFGLLSYFSIIM